MTCMKAKRPAGGRSRVDPGLWNPGKQIGSTGLGRLGPSQPLNLSRDFHLHIAVVKFIKVPLPFYIEQKRKREPPGGRWVFN